ncbi:HEAT repeat domain-containing protein [Streptomyces alfalfae]|uniref:HEAT repeat domain-containing protein n=1 Tax=Streptomyces alfalfae TaxID=1642299 RepID=UPI001BA7E562|nr:HEAT repeat domain-containing protein [Streptomyces alfalfae]QUI34425.1 HEAT repeat domain-containing protein [Streptomyces alfalfae]
MEPDIVRMRLERDVAGLSEVMRSGPSPHYVWAVDLLREIGGREAADALLDCVDRPDAYPKWLHLHALSALAELRDRRALPRILKDARRGGPEHSARVARLYEDLGAIGGPEAVRELVHRLGDPEPPRMVVEAVARLRPPEAVPALLGALWTLLLRDEMFAVETLGAMRDPRTAPALLYLAASEGSSPRLRKRAVLALAQLPEDCWPPPAGLNAEFMLTRALRDPDAATARPAAALLARTDYGMEILRDHVHGAAPWKPAEYRTPVCAAVTVCAHIQERPALFGQDGRDVPNLVALLGERSVPMVRRAAASALGAVGGKAATEALLAALGGDRTGDTVARALSALPAPPVRELLAMLADDAREARPRRRGAAIALGLLECADAAPLLLDALGPENYRDVRAAAADALGDLRHEPAVARLSSLAGDDEEPGTLRARAVHALGRIGAPESLPVLLTAVHDPSEPVRVQAAQGLGRFPVREASAALGKVASTDASRDVARCAVRALGRMGAPAVPVLAALAGQFRRDVGEELVTALAECPGAEAVAGLAALATSPEAADVRLSAIRALADRRSPDCAAPLASLLTADHTPRIHFSALRGLAALDTEEADAHVLTYCRTKGLASAEARAALRDVADRRR